MSLSRCFSALSALVVAAALVACGGGGGGGEDTGGGGPGPGSPTGLVPASPALGATLYTDTALLYMARAGTQRHFRGSASTASVYGTLVTLTDANGAVALRRQSSLPDDDEESTLSIAGGRVDVRETLAFDPANPIETVNYTLLRSPVRVGDQITLYERTALDIRADLNGDGRSEVVDVAAYSRVIGNESVDLPDLQRTVQALRVDTTLRMRVPAGGTTEIGIVQSDWYAPGIGPVRRRVVDLTTGAAEAEEWLVYWDGLTEGMGALPPRKVASNGGTGPTLFGLPWSAVRLGNRVLMASTINTNSFPDPNSGMVLTALNERGEAVASARYPEARPGMRPIPLQAVAGNVLMLTQVIDPPADNQATYSVNMQRFDANANRVGDATGVTLVSKTTLYGVAAASDGQKLWLLWADVDTATDSYRLMLRDFSVDGQPIGAARLIKRVSGLSQFVVPFQQLGLSVHADRMMASWRGGAQSYALIIGGAEPIVRDLGVPAGPSREPVLPFVGNGLQGLSWLGLLGFEGYSNNNDVLLRGVMVNDDASVLSSSAGTLDDEILATGEGIDGGTMYGGLVYAEADRFAAAVLRVRPFVAGDPWDGLSIEINRWTAGRALAGAPPSSTEKRRLVLAGFSPAASFGNLRFVVPLDDRDLIIGSDDYGIATSVLFRR